MDIKKLIEQFIEVNGGTKDDIQVFFAPGRVNLMFCHTVCSMVLICWFGL
jgi:galactokinase